MYCDDCEIDHVGQCPHLRNVIEENAETDFIDEMVDGFNEEWD